jgi:hypothetical protein
MTKEPFVADFAAFYESKPTFKTFVEHWAKSRLDVPMQVISRFDDAAKQLITIGSILQGLYIAAFTFGNLKHQVPTWLLCVLFAPLILLIFCAAQAICVVPLKKEAFDTYALFKSEAGLTDEELTSAMHKWCQNIDKIADRKHLWLRFAKYFLVINSAITLLVLLFLMRM